jgi:hypothetical protein
MNPYLEQDAVWSDFHLAFLPAVRARLVARVRPTYIVLLEEHLVAQDVERVPYLEVRDRTGRELIAVVELLGPSNKRGADREQYLTKRAELIRSPAHLVEIDLLRGGRPMPQEGRPACDDSVLVSRAESRPQAGFWPIGLRDRLPVIPIPLRAEDEAARIDLQEVLHSVYDASGYEDHIYEGDPQPALSPGDAAWARTFVPRSP